MDDKMCSCTDAMQILKLKEKKTPKICKPEDSIYLVVGLMKLLAR